MNRSGQALVEWAVLLPLFTMLFLAIFIFGRWFAIRYELILAAREGALLYSSARMNRQEVQQHLLRNLRHGSPALRLQDEDVKVGQASGFQARLWELDEVRVRYGIPLLWKRWLKMQDMEEVCVIKHSPAYGPVGAPIGVHYGRPVGW